MDKDDIQEHEVVNDNYKDFKQKRLSNVASDGDIIKKKTSFLRKQDSALALPALSKMENLEEKNEYIKNIIREGSLDVSMSRKRKISYKPAVPTYILNNIMDTNPQELDEDTELHVKKKGVTAMLLLTVVAISLSSFQYGWAIGVVNAPQKIVMAWYNQTHYERHQTPMKPSQITVLWAITVSIYNVSGLFGGLTSGYFCDKFGRKKTLLINNSITFLAAILLITAKTASSFEMVIISRLLIGFNCGITSSAVSIYLAEISPVNIRGAMCSAHQVSLSFGILLSQIIGLPHALGTDHGWPTLF
ncbi:unnamed protein product, partial [Gordionus sp. m RMFG-2023]